MHARSPAQVGNCTVTYAAARRPVLLSSTQRQRRLIGRRAPLLIVCAALKGQRQKQLYQNVVWSGSDSTWKVILVVDGKRHQFGRFDQDQAEAAARLRDKLVLRFWGSQDAAHPLNFPADEYEAQDWMQLPGLDEYREKWGPVRSCKFTGITWRIGVQKWHARVCHDGRQYSAGLHADQEAAARAYDLLVVRLLGDAAADAKKLNYPADLAGYKVLARGAGPVQECEPTSQYNGVSYKTSAKAWLASLNVDGNVVYESRFRSPEAAARAYDKAVMQHLPKGYR